MTASGQGRAGKSTARAFRDKRLEWKCTTELGKVVMKWPEATMSALRCTEIVIKLILGSLRPRAWKASDTIRFGQLPGVPRIQGSLISSARSIFDDGPIGCAFRPRQRRGR